MTTTPIAAGPNDVTVMRDNRRICDNFTEVVASSMHGTLSAPKN